MYDYCVGINVFDRIHTYVYTIKIVVTYIKTELKVVIMYYSTVYMVGQLFAT